VRILYLTPGHASHDSRFAEAIRDAGHDVVVCIVPDSLTDHAPRLESVRSVVTSAHPDVIHAGPIQSIARLVAEIGSHPHLAVSWGFDLLADTRDLEKRDQARWTLRRADALLADCAAVRSTAIGLGMAPDRIITLPWGVDLAKFRPGRTPDGDALRRKAGWDHEVVVVMTRSLEPVRGVDVALTGFLAAADVRPELRLLIVGDGSLRPILEQQVARSGAVSRVRFAGSLSPGQMGAPMAAADAYLSASHIDGTSLGLLEAMASGLPAVASDVGGTGEWVEPGRSGYLFPDGDADALASALVDLATSGRARRRELGQRGRQIVEARADWRANVPRLIHAYEVAHDAAGKTGS
jgi:glycosyltransferase involved in cell wall biosynthesis